MNITVNGNKLTIEVDISTEARKNAPVSSTGKTRLVASTNGFRPIPGTDLKVGLNVTTPLDQPTVVVVPTKAAPATRRAN